MNFFHNFLKCVFCLVLIFSVVGGARAQMKMHVINVGQAEAVLLEFRSAAILVDAGGETTFETDMENRFRKHLLEYLESFFDRRTDLDKTLHSVVVSHPHKDHTRNLRMIFDAFTVRHFVEGGGSTGSGIADVREIRNLAAAKNFVRHRVYASNVKKAGTMKSWRKELFDGSEVDVRFLSGGRGCNDENNASLVMRVAYKNKSFLLTGDAEEEDPTVKGKVGCGGLLYRLLNPQVAFPELLDVDVLKVSHHGSHNGTFELFLQKVTPEFSVISAGSHQTRSRRDWKYHAYFYGHPREEAVGEIEKWTTRKRPPATVTTMPKVKLTKSRLLEQAIYSTVWDGDIVLSVNEAGDDITIAASGIQ